MTSMIEKLKNHAEQIAQNLNSRKAQLDKEAQKLFLQAQKKETEGKAAGMAVERARKFRPKIGDEYFCPWCWVQDGVLSPLRNATGTSDLDFFDCGHCSFEETSSG